MSVKRVTSQDVARRAGVSRTTVSLVLNNVSEAQISEETRQRVLESARALNYHPDASARRLVQGRTQVIGFVERQAPSQDFADAFMGEVLRGFHKAARREGYHVLFEPFVYGQDPKDRYVQVIREHHADGIVLSGPRFDDQELIDLHREGIPIVLQGRLPGSNIPCVDVDNVAGARLATEHLVCCGHEDIGLITNGPTIYTAASERKMGFMHALQEAGLPVNKDWIKTAAFTPQSGFIAMRDMLSQKERPSAVFVASDTVAIGALDAVRKAGLCVPEDLALVGFDDVPWAAYIDPPLTTVRLPAHALGWSAGYLLIRILNGEKVEEPTVLLDTELVVRKSCGS